MVNNAITQNGEWKILTRNLRDFLILILNTLNMNFCNYFFASFFDKMSKRNQKKFVPNGCYHRRLLQLEKAIVHLHKEKLAPIPET